jgi:trehalose 6-phosphate synthase
VSVHHTSDFVIVANRLPVDRVVHDDGEVEWRTSPGGLVTAMEPVMRTHDGAWIGWAGGTDSDLEPFEQDNMTLVPVCLDAQEVEDFYEGFSNATLWPLYHDVVAKPVFHREWWDAYVAVNRRYAERAADVAAEGATVWVHDYQLQLVPAMLREARPDLRIGFFLHIPFPPAELFQQLPWRRQILEGLLGADLVGFQRPNNAQNFVRLVRQRVGHKTHRDLVYLPDGRIVQAAAFPISIDAEGLEELARSESVATRAKEIREQLGNPRHVLLGVDRLDYTKGIYSRLRAFGELLAEGTLSVDDTVFVQVATPSRERVEQYRRLRDDIDRLVGRINGDLGRIGRPAARGRPRVRVRLVVQPRADQGRHRRTRKLRRHRLIAPRRRDGRARDSWPRWRSSRRSSSTAPCSADSPCRLACGPSRCGGCPCWSLPAPRSSWRCRCSPPGHPRWPSSSPPMSSTCATT